MEELVKELGKDSKYLKENKKYVFEEVLDACLESIPEFTARSPVDTGLYASSWEVEPERYEAVFFGNTAPYAAVIEHGARPFEAPIKPLLEWAARKLQREISDPEVRRLAWGVKKKFEREGMKPLHIMSKGVDEVLIPNILGRLK